MTLKKCLINIWFQKKTHTHTQKKKLISQFLRWKKFVGIQIFLYFFFFNLTTKHNPGLVTCLTCSKAIKSQRNFYTLPWYFFPKWVYYLSSFFFCKCSRQSRAPQKLRQWQWPLQLSPSFLYVFHVFLVDLAIEKRKYCRCSRL